METDKYERKALADRALIAELQTKSAIIETKIVTEYVDRIKIVDQIKATKTKIYVTKNDDSACVISLSTSDAIAKLLNSATDGKVPQSTP